MMHGMNTIGMNSGFGFSVVWIIHALSMIVFVAGLVFLLVWAVKTLPMAQLLRWAIGLLVGGALVCLLTIGVTGHPWTGGWTTGGNAMMNRATSGGMGMGCSMMKDKGGSMGMMGMMSTMGTMLEGLEGDEFDEAFIRMMIPHHEGAVDMAEAALESAKHAEMKQLATDIIEAQRREIDMMKGWLTTWGYEN